MCANYKIVLVPDLDEYSLAVRVAYASDGVMSYIIKLFAAVTRRQLRDRLKHCDLKLFDEVFRAVIWETAPDERNPFVGDGVQTRLTGVGEPFAPDAAAEGWDQ